MLHDGSLSRRLVEERRSAVDDAGVHRVEVGPHGRRRVRVAEHLLNVEQVEVVRAVLIRAAVEDAGGRAAEVVRRDVSEACLSSAPGDDFGDGSVRHGERCRPPEPVAVVGADDAGGEQRVVRRRRPAEALGVARQVVAKFSWEGSLAPVSLNSWRISRP